MNTRIRINLNEGSIEAEGEEAFVKSIYDDFKNQLATARTNDGGSAEQAGVEHSPAAPKAGSAPRKALSKRAKAGFTIVKDLDLSGKNNSKSLRDFYTEKVPSTAMERNVVFVYFLKQVVSVAQVTLDHIYSCYKDVGVKYPNALRQSVADTSSRRGWLDTKSFDDIKLATPGENYVEHDLPKARA